MDMHKTMAMDDKFNSLVLKAQTAVDKLVSLAADMHEADHKPTQGQKSIVNELKREVDHLVSSL